MEARGMTATASTVATSAAVSRANAQNNSLREGYGSMESPMIGEENPSSSDHNVDAASVSSHFVGSSSHFYEDDDDDVIMSGNKQRCCGEQRLCWRRCGRRLPCSRRRPFRLPTLRQLALSLSLYCNIAITVWKLVAYLQTFSLSVLAALLDSVLDVVSQAVLNYTEHHSNMQKRSSAFYPAGASRLEPIGVLVCAALMGMASFEVLKESITTLAFHSSQQQVTLKPELSSVTGMVLIVFIKLGLLWLCRRGALKRTSSRVLTKTMATDAIATVSGAAAHVTDETRPTGTANAGLEAMTASTRDDTSYDESNDYEDNTEAAILADDETLGLLVVSTAAATKSVSYSGSGGGSNVHDHGLEKSTSLPLDDDIAADEHGLQTQMADPTLEALAQDHWNDCLSNGVAAVALVLVVHDGRLWFLDPIGAIIISIYIIYSWFTTGREQIEHLTGRSAPEEFIEELVDLANSFDERITVDTVRAYHFGPKFLVEIEIVMDASTLLFESHDVGMELQYEIEGREEVERCFVHIDYQTRPYDEHVVSKVPELRDKYTKQQSFVRSSRSV